MHMAEKVVRVRAAIACEALTRPRLICQSQIRRFLSHRPKIPNNRQGQGTSFVWSRPLIASQKPVPWPLLDLLRPSLFLHSLAEACWLVWLYLLFRIRLLSIVVGSGRAASCICSPVSRHVLFLVIPTSPVLACFKLLILFSVTKFPLKKKTKTVMRTKNISTRWSFSMMKKMLTKKSFFEFNIYLDDSPMFFVQASLLLPLGFDGSEQYFWICNGSCAAFYLDDFISDFTEQRAYAIWNGIAFLARSNIFCHSSKSFYSDSRKHYFMPLEHISVLIYQGGQGTMPAHSWNQCSNYLAILLLPRHRQIRKGRLAICSG